MDPYSIEEEPGWFSSLITWTSDLWAYWTAPAPEKLPYDRSVFRARIELCLTRFKVLRRKNELIMKQNEKELLELAKEESALAEIKVAQHFSVVRFQKLMDLLEPHLVLLQNSIDLPAHDMSPILAVRSVIYASTQSHTIEELIGIRQQLLQKYNPALAVIKIELIDQELINIFDTSRSIIDALEWLNKIAPGRCWAEKLEKAKLLHQNTLSSSPSFSHQPPIPSDDSKERIIEIPDAPDHSDNDDDPDGGLGHSHNSGPTDSPIPPIEVIDFPELPPLYPSLSLSDSIESPSLTQSAAN